MKLLRLLFIVLFTAISVSAYSIEPSTQIVVRNGKKVYVHKVEKGHPLPAEEDACIDFLRRQVRLIRPKIIVCLGRISAMRLIKPDFKITKEHGEWFEKGDFLITAVYHPALLLRDPRRKEEMLIDMKKIKEKLDSLEG